MKKFGIILIGVCLALSTSCSKDKSDDEPIVPKEKQQPEETQPEVTRSDKTGKFDVEWNCLGMQTTKGKIEADGEYFFLDDFPAETIFSKLIDDIRTSVSDTSEVRTHLTDTIGNIFFASDYKYYGTYQVLSHTKEDSCHTIIHCVMNDWDGIAWTITVHHEPPYPDETIFIDSPDMMSISFGIDADGVPYRIDLISKDKEAYADFDEATGLWTFNYWFNAFRIINRNTGRQYDMGITYSGYPRRHDKEDTILLEFKATKRTGDAEGRIICY